MKRKTLVGIEVSFPLFRLYGSYPVSDSMQRQNTIKLTDLNSKLQAIRNISSIRMCSL